jgi:hypothetical protein
MASFWYYSSRQTVKPKTQTAVENPPFCWIISDHEGSKVFISDGCLLIFKTWHDARAYIFRMDLLRCNPKLLPWDVLVMRCKNVAQEIILDCGDGSYVSFPVKL